MRVLYIYRNPQMGFSIGKVFKPIEEEIKKKAEVDCLYMPSVGYGLSAIWNNIKSVRFLLKTKRYDVVHITGTEHYLIPFLRGQNVVVTVHDLGSIYNNNLGRFKQFLKSLLFVSPLKKASVVTFISDKSREEAKKYFELSEENVCVIPDAVDSSYHFEKKEFNRENPRLLHLGTKINKNIPRIAEALNGLKCELRIIGKLTQEQITALDNNNITYSSAFGLTDEQIYEEYKQCDIVCFPSTYEGFGMPIIEGQSVGRVVVTSNFSPMKEVSGGGAILVDPFNVDSIRKGFEEAIANHEKYIEIGKVNVKKYNVENVAEQYFDLYKRMLP